MKIPHTQEEHVKKLYEMARTLKNDRSMKAIEEARNIRSYACILQAPGNIKDIVKTTEIEKEVVEHIMSKFGDCKCRSE